MQDIRYVRDVGDCFGIHFFYWSLFGVTDGSTTFSLLYTKQNTDRMLKFDWLRAGPYACVRTGVWTGWTSVHNNKWKHWLFVVLLVWVYNKALINLEFGPYGKYLLWRHAAWTSLRSVHTAWRHNKYFRVWTALSVNKSILFSTRQYYLNGIYPHELSMDVSSRSDPVPCLFFVHRQYWPRFKLTNENKWGQDFRISNRFQWHWSHDMENCFANGNRRFR